MIPAEKTKALIDGHIEATQELSHRMHLGASVIGDPCSRKLFYKWRWALVERHKAQLLRLFKRGHLEEPNFLKLLTDVGIEVWPIDPKTRAQWRCEDHDGHFGGSCDGVARGIPDLPPGTPILISCKTHNEKSFGKLLESGVMGSKFEHFVQEQIYLHYSGYEWCLYMALNKNTDDLHCELIHYDKKVAENAISRGGDIIYANEPPLRISKSPGYWYCNFCHYNRLCHFGDVTPDKNCRTCKFSRVGGKVNGEAVWICGVRNVSLDKTAQLAGCNSYQQHEKLSGVQE